MLASQIISQAMDFVNSQKELDERISSVARQVSAGDKSLQVVADKCFECLKDSIGGDSSAGKRIVDDSDGSYGEYLKILQDLVRCGVDDKHKLAEDIFQQVINPLKSANSSVDVAQIAEDLKAGVNGGILLDKGCLDKLLLYALTNDNLDLAFWALQKGGNAAFLDDVEKTSCMKPDSVSWLKTSCSLGPISLDNLDDYALRMGLGYKTSNLKLMNRLLGEMSKGLKECEVEVPPPLGIPMSHLALSI